MKATIYQLLINILFLSGSGSQEPFPTHPAAPVWRLLDRGDQPRAERPAGGRAAPLSYIPHQTGDEQHRQDLQEAFHGQSEDGESGLVLCITKKTTS